MRGGERESARGRRGRLQHARKVQQHQLERGSRLHLRHQVRAALDDRFDRETALESLRAIAFAAHPDLMGDRERLLEKCATVAAGRTNERFRYANELAEMWRKDRAVLHGTLDVWETFWEARMREAMGDRETALEALRAIEAVLQCRADLLTQVQTRPAFELMLLDFPRVLQTTAAAAG